MWQRHWPASERRLALVSGRFTHVTTDARSSSTAPAVGSAARGRQHDLGRLVFLFALPLAGAGMRDLVRDPARSITVEAVDAGWL